MPQAPEIQGFRNFRRRVVPIFPFSAARACICGDPRPFLPCESALRELGRAQINFSLQSMKYAVQRLLQVDSFHPRTFVRKVLINLMCSSVSMRMRAMAVSPSSLRGRLLRGRGSPGGRIPCFEA